MLARGLKIAIGRAEVCSLLFLCVLLSRSDLPDLRASRAYFLLQQISDSRFPAVGRFTSMPYPRRPSQPLRWSAQFARILAASNDQSPLQRRILSLVYVLDGRLVEAQR